MSAAVAMKKSEHEAAAEPQKRSALGPSERTSGMRRVLSLAARPGAIPAARKGILLEALKELFLADLKSTGSAGLVHVPHLMECIAEGKYREAAATLVEIGHSAHEAQETMESIAGALAPGLIEVEGFGILGVAGLAFKIAKYHAAAGLAVIAQAHADGDHDAAVVNYAQTWARVVTDALYGGGVSRPERTGIAHLDEARQRAWTDALATLRELDAGSAKALADQLKQELGTPTNARLALVTELLKQAGMNGIKLHEGGPVR